MSKRKRKGASKRTISPEQQARMQAARARKRAHSAKMAMLREAGMDDYSGVDPAIAELRAADAERTRRLQRKKGAFGQ